MISPKEFRISTFIGGGVLAWALIGTSAVKAEDRFVGMLADGARISGDDISNWHEDDSTPALAGHPLFQGENPVRWVIDQSLPPAELPTAYVEFAGTERLPGVVKMHNDGRDSEYDLLPAHLIVEPSVNWNHPELEQRAAVRVVLEDVTRIVWQSDEQLTFQPQTLFLRDGRQVRFRAIRWSSDSLSVLLEDEIQTYAFDVIAELHFPKPNVWERFYSQLAVLSPTATGALMQLETTDGLRATTSTERFTVRARGDKRKPENWYHAVQPAWSLDPIWVRHREVRTRRCFSPAKLPLSLIAPSRIEQQSTFGTSWRFQLDRNVRRQPLKGGDGEYGWGFGVHATCHLHFPLPESAVAFQTRMGLDEFVGRGGCVKATIAMQEQSADGAQGDRRSLFSSDLFIGAKTVVDSGRLELAPTDHRDLVLSVDDAHADRPANADPFDIRDSFDWFDPILELDADGLRNEVQHQLRTQIAGWNGWTHATEPEALKVVNHWDTSNPRDPRFRLLISPNGASVTISRTLMIGESDHWLALVVSRFKDSPGDSTLRVQVDGDDVAEFAVPTRHNWDDPDALLVPMQKFRGRKVNVRITQFAKSDEAAVDWRAITLTKHRPGLLPIFEDERNFAGELREGDGTATHFDNEAAHGDACLKITPPGKANPQLSGLNVPIRDQPQLGEYKYILFVWKKRGGKRIALELAHDGHFGGDLEPEQVERRKDFKNQDRGEKHGYRYDAGSGEPVNDAALRLDRKPPGDWVTVTRNLAGDFGEFQLTGLSFVCPDGEFALFDHIYLARRQEDLRHIKELLEED